MSPNVRLTFINSMVCWFNQRVGAGVHDCIGWTVISMSFVIRDGIDRDRVLCVVVIDDAVQDIDGGGRWRVAIGWRIRMASCWINGFVLDAVRSDGFVLDERMASCWINGLRGSVFGCPATGWITGPGRNRFNFKKLGEVTSSEVQKVG